jgi:outer membrane lipoprotein-sorting protein
MSELGDLLELLHGARDRWTTVRLTIRAWRHHERSMQAWKAQQDSHEGATWTHFGIADGEPEPEMSQMLTRLWIHGDRLREECEGDEHAHLGIRRGRLWWIYDEMNGAISNENNPDHGSSVGELYRRLLDPSRIIGGVRFDILGRTSAAGRDGIRVLAIPRATDNPYRDLPDLEGAADEHELVVDAERGVLLRVASRFRGENFHVQDVLDIAFDEQFPDELFVFEPPEGERVRPAGARLTLPDVTLVEAQRAASFTVWIPRPLDAGWQLRAIYMPAEERPPTPEGVSIHYFRDDASHQFSLHEVAARERDEFAGAWDELEHEGEQLLVAETPQARVRVEREGTQITIHSQDLEVERLLELVDLLVPAPDEPPPLSG